jgi:GTP-binding protein
MDLLDSSAVVYQIILTKTDKIKTSELADVITKTKEQIAKRVAAYPELVATSSEKGDGLDQLRLYVSQLAE